MLLILLKVLIRLVPVFSYFCKLCIQALFYAVSTAIVVNVCAICLCRKYSIPRDSRLCMVPASTYLDIHCLPPEAFVGLVPGGLILPRYWDFSQCWYSEGWSRISPIVAGLLLNMGRLGWWRNDSLWALCLRSWSRWLAAQGYEEVELSGRNQGKKGSTTKWNLFYHKHVEQKIIQWKTDRDEDVIGANFQIYKYVQLLV